ncbi:uncharacterized protein LOC128722468 [Anopheles nili]|uniref:uncharacterized protein LOC128722468 n=1 Tax=Anopheles nili TaxID=185578 RepID=UPI00237BE2A4|nr:uncharacterized protein LOC128722468 [Anopheles nili]
MLKPLKNLLTYLQRNANSSNIFGLTTTSSTTMGPTEQPRLEETIMIANEVLPTDDVDPLYDPLAVDECPVPGANTSSGSIGSEDDEGVSAGEITLVDVTSLKSKLTEHELDTDDDDDVLEPQESGAGCAQAVVEVADELSDTSCELLSSEEVVDVLDSVTIIHMNDNIDENEVIQVDSDLSVEYQTLNTSGESVAGETVKPLEETCPIVTVKEPDQTKRQLNGHFVDVVELPDGSVCTEAGEATTVEQIQGTNGEEEEEASDGSDSGLGLEPSRNVATCGDSTSNSPLERVPIKSSLKRRSESLGLTGEASIQEEKDIGIRDQKRIKKGITFDGVTVYYFPRMQGFGCVPSQGGCTLGMEYQHVHSRRLTLSEHSAEQRKVHRQQLQELNPRSSSSDDTSSEEEPSESASEAESESYGFLQPVTTRQRRALLKAAGVRKIDPTEKDECREIRTSREVCGCTCRGFCDPNRCPCSLAGIKCQVDRPSFPCGCTHDGCANTAGRVEFNPGRVQTHYMHTLMRLRMEGIDNVIDTRQSMLLGNASGSGTNASVLLNASSASKGDSGTAESGYVMGSEKNWSHGPVRLPPGMVVYGAGMHPDHSLGSNDMGDGIGTMHQSQGTLHASHSHSLQQFGNHLAHHQPSMAMLHGGGHLQHHHAAHQASSYLNHQGGEVSGQNYLVASVSSASHMLSAGLSPSSMGSLDVQYAFRNYYPVSGGGGGGIGAVRGGPELVATTTGSSQHSPCSSSEPTQHVGAYYGDNYAAFEVVGPSSSSLSSGTDHYRQEHLTMPDALLPLHVHDPAGSGTTAARENMLTTGHDRHHQQSSFGHSHHPPSLQTQRVDRVNDACESGVPRVPNVGAGDPTVESLDTLIGSNFACTDSTRSIDLAMLPYASSTPATADAARVCEQEVAPHDESIIISDNDSTEGVTNLEDVETPTLETLVGQSSVMDRDGKTADRSACSSVEIISMEPGVSSRPVVSIESTSFIDLTAPHAGNTERLEAINDMLEISRHTASIAQRSIVAEEDDELRDFRHPPPSSTVEEPLVISDDDKQDVISSCNVRLERLQTTGSTIKDALSQNDSESPAGTRKDTEFTNTSNGIAEDSTEQQQQEQIQSTSAKTDASKRFGTLLEKNLDSNGVSSSYAATTDSPALVPSSTDSPPTSASPEPSENLCEIIKNSIVETAVLH